jgi:hypothetical protein
MKDQLENNLKNGEKMSNIWRFFLVILGPLLLCLTAIVIKLVPPVILFAPFWLLGLIIFSFIQLIAWIFGLAWYKNGGIKFLQNSGHIKKFHNTKENGVYDFFGVITAISIAIAIVPYLIALLLVIFFIIFGKLMEGGPLD